MCISNHVLLYQIQKKLYPHHVLLCTASSPSEAQQQPLGLLSSILQDQWAKSSNILAAFPLVMMKPTVIVEATNLCTHWPLEWFVQQLGIAGMPAKPIVEAGPRLLGPLFGNLLC